MGARVVQFEAGFARERQPQDVARDPGDVGVHVLQKPRRLVDTDALQQLRRERAGDVDRTECQRAVEHVHVEAPRLDPVTDPRLGERRRRRR